MTDTSKCFSLLRGKMARITRLDGCGAVVLGPDSAVITKGVITVGLTVQTDEGTTVQVQNFNGENCIRDVPAPEFLGYGAEINFCNVNPDAIRLLTGQPMVTDSQTTPQGVGFRMNQDVNLDDAGFALEIWNGVYGQNCIDGDKSYGYMLLPFVKGGVIGDFSIGNDAINFTVSGANTKPESEWGVGPFDVTRDNSGDPSPLKDAIDSGDHLHVELVTVAPPTEVCGAVAVGVPATTFTAGIPATPTPANGYAPLNLAGMTGIIASPLTAWTSGQGVLLRNGLYAHWNSTTWVTGVA